ncbi:hypothetical protein LWI28_015868 [Acer negundo]|uniref:Time for coffee n=1 Tax=Acer negundo TaxID=4023 RepID=A0AAD5NUJ2_ACENE|nr:hypothetical protein LWI28_013359 [Acer negundo]KAI9181526.1 hypothetical protein LWI28_015868 [Acer negundo]
MDRSREARRSNQTSANVLSRRRQRSSGLRDSHEEDGQMELQDTVRLRDRAHQRDRDRYRDREFSNHHKKIQNKRRRGDGLMQENNREGGESTEGSVADEEEYEIQERRLTHINSYNTTPFSSSLSNHRKNLPPTRPVKQALVLKATDEMIGVLVPRKARSASVKRSHENWVFGNGGFWEDHRASTSTASRSAEANSPSSSNVSVRKKMKPNGPKTRLPKASKSSGSVQQDDIEIEIAEVLFGLRKQSQNSNNEDDNTLQKLESKDVNSISQESKPSVSVLAQNNSPASDLLHAPKMNKVEADNSSNPGENSSIASPDKFEFELPGKMENSSAPESQKSAISCEASQVLDAAKESVESQEEVRKQGDSKPSIEGSGYTDGPVTERNPVSDVKESALCAKIGVDLQDSTVTKASWTASERESRKEEKFKIDLMQALPPMASSPDRDGLNDFASNPNLYHVNMKSDVKDENVKKAAIEELEEKKIEPIGESRKMKFDLEKPNADNGRDNIINKLQSLSQKQPQQPSKSTMPKVEKSAHSSSVPLQIAVAGWANGVPQMGYMPPFQAIVPMDGSARSAAAQQPPQFVLSQPQPKRCTTHHYIARNISLNQQLAKMNRFSPVGAGSAPLQGGKPSSINVIPSTENLIHGNLLQGSFPVVNLNSVQDKGQAAASFPAVTQKVKSSEGVNVMDPAQSKQFVLQQAPQPASPGNILHVPAFIFPVSQQQATVTGAANQSGPLKSATSNKSTSFSSNSTSAFPSSSTSLPPVAAAVSYSYSNMTILQNNGYPFPVPTPIGAPPAIRGSHSQALPYFNGSFYSSQFFHPSQLQQQQQPNSQPLIQAHQNTNTPSASSSSYKQPQSQQPRGMPVSGSNILSSTSAQQPQQSQKQHVPPSNKNRKLEAEMSGENTPSLAESRISQNQTSAYGQNFSVPLQPLNYALMPSSAVSGSNNGGNHGEKQQQSQQKNLKGGVEAIPPQAFAMSFASFSGSNNTGSNLSFSSMPQNPAIFQSQGYQVAPAAQVAQQKNHQMSEMKTGGGSSNHDDSKKTGLGKSATTNGQTLVFDNPARTLNFVSTPFTGNWPSRSITQTAQVASNSQNFHQNQLLQHPKQQYRSKPQTSNSQSSSSIAAKHSNNGSIFPQTIVQGNSCSQSPQWKNSTRTPTSQVPPTSVASSNVLNHKNVPQQQVRSPQGQTQISFERNSKSGLAPQGHQIPTSNQSPLITCSTGSKAGSSIPTLQPENSSASTGQKSSPVCGRNVPSILSTCASQLSELKY